MKITVTADLEDFFNEGDEGSFNEQILYHLESQLKNQIWGEFKKLALDEFKAKIDRELAKGKDEETDRIISKIFSEKKIKVKESTKGNPEPEMITLFEYIEERLTKDYFNPSSSADTLLSYKLKSKQIEFEKAITAASDKLGTEIKERYDLLFASQLVAKMNKSGLLKDDVANILLKGE